MAEHVDKLMATDQIFSLSVGLLIKNMLLNLIAKEDDKDFQANEAYQSLLSKKKKKEVINELLQTVAHERCDGFVALLPYTLNCSIHLLKVNEKRASETRYPLDRKSMNSFYHDCLNKEPLPIYLWEYQDLTIGVLIDTSINSVFGEALVE